MEDNKSDAKKLLRELVMRSRLGFPESEEDSQWWDQGLKVKKSGDFIKRVYHALDLGNDDEAK